MDIHDKYIEKDINNYHDKLLRSGYVSLFINDS